MLKFSTSNQTNWSKQVVSKTISLCNSWKRENHMISHRVQLDEQMLAFVYLQTRQSQTYNLRAIMLYSLNWPFLKMSCHAHSLFDHTVDRKLRVLYHVYVSPWLQIELHYVKRYVYVDCSISSVLASHLEMIVSCTPVHIKDITPKSTKTLALYQATLCYILQETLSCQWAKFKSELA